jgi:very-short-patch-repair endonuclease
MRGKSGSAEQVAARLASGQQGLVTREQLLERRVPANVIDRRVAKGVWSREHPGVYRVGHGARTAESTYMAAVLAAGDGALLSGRAAAHLLRLLKGPPPAPEIIATTKRRIDGATTARVRKIDPRDATEYRGIPCTTVPRTLVDLAATLDHDDLARAFHEASVLYRTTPEQVEAVLKRRPNSKGAAKLRAVLRGDAKVALSKLERRFLEILDANDLELPETNKQIGRYYVDCRWPARKLTIELDSYRYHGTRHAWEQDRKREREARKRGDDFRRFTWGDVFEEPQALINELRPILST